MFHKRCNLLGAGILLFVFPSLLGVLPASDARAAKSERTKWWEEARFGMFIHWGVYSLLGRGEWVMFHEKIPVFEYEKLYPRFNPTEFDAREWVSLAKAAGQKYIVITSKHHDGFCMFDSKLTTYTIMHTPFAHDPMKDLARECKRQGIKLCFYYSILDWHHPDYLPRRKWDKRPTDNADFNRYIEYMKGQLRELLTNYGDIGVIWFDGGWEHSPEEIKAQELLDLIHKLQPNCLVNNRARLPGDFETPEQRIPASGLRRNGKPVLWETCMTINRSWGYNKNDHNYKSVKELVQKLADIASKGGNFLLNVGPMPNGKIQPEFVERLRGVGKWMDKYGESIYATQAGPFRIAPSWGRCTTKGHTLYMHVFDWHKQPFILRGLKAMPQRIRVLGSSARAEAKVGDEGLLVSVAGPAPDSYDSVIALEFAKMPEVDETIYPKADGRVYLPAVFADIHGRRARYESGGGLDNIGYWTDKRDWVSWDFVTRKPGKYDLELTYACTDGNAGSEYVVAVGKNKLAGKVDSTGGWKKFKTIKLGTVELAAGRHTLSVKPKTMPHGAVMNLRRIVLRPVE